MSLKSLAIILEIKYRSDNENNRISILRKKC